MGTIVRGAGAASTVELAATLAAHAGDEGEADELDGRGRLYLSSDGGLTLVTRDDSRWHFGTAGGGSALVAGWPAEVPVPVGRIVSSASVPLGWAAMVEVADLAAAGAGLWAIVEEGFAEAGIWGTERARTVLDDPEASRDDNTVWLENDRYLVAYVIDLAPDAVTVQVEVSYRDR